MDIKQIRQMITSAFSHENNTGFAANAVRNFAQLMGRRVSDADVQGTVDFIKEYIQHVPALLEEVEKAARKAGIRNQVLPILQAAEQYFLQPLDAIPDNLGLLGLMDDAYLAHCLFQSVSDRHRQNTGQALLGTDMTAANRVIRVLIGEPIATTLDMSVMSVLQGPTIQQAIQQLMNFAAQSPINVPDPIYGNASIDDIVKVRLGAIGIF